MITIQPSTRSYFIYALVFVIALLATTVADAATYYVATNGNDSVSCAVSTNISTPKHTIASGLSCVAAGDTLYIRQGTYGTHLQETMFAATGTPGSPITVARYQNEVVTIASGDSYTVRFQDNSIHDVILDGLIIDATSTDPGADAPGMAVHTTANIIFKNGEIKNSQGNGILGGGPGFQLLNSKIHDNGHSTTYIPGSNGAYMSMSNNGVFRGNEFYNNACYGLRVWTSGLPPETASNNVIEQNLFHENGKNFNPNGTPCGSGGGGLTIGDQNNTFRNNIVYHNLEGAELVGGGSGTSNGIDIYNNLFYKNGIGITAPGPGTTNATIANNHIVGSTVLDLDDAHIGTHTYLTNRIGGVVTDCTVSTIDFHLKAGATCIDVGTTIPSVTNDFARITRPQGGAYDIGAYEMSGTNVLPTPPQNLRVN